jgi:hypothetical protein
VSGQTRGRGRPASRRWIISAAVGALVASGIVIGIVLGSHGSGGGAKEVAVTASGAKAVGRDTVLFRATALDRNFGRLALVPSGDPHGPRSLSRLTCDRADFAGGRGLCVSKAKGLFGSTQALVFDDEFRTLHSIEVTGIPSLARVSPDGRYGAVTNFVGDGGDDSSGFSPQTDLIDMQAGTVLFDLEKLRVRYNGETFAGADFSFRCVTFAADSQHFYATLGTGGRTYLIEANVTTRQASVLRPDVDCPSLSPDGKHIALKARDPGPVVRWRLSVLDLSTLVDHPVAETRDVDDQVAWLDNNTLMYGVPTSSTGGAAVSAVTPEVPITSTGSVRTDTWAVPANGKGTPALLIPGAWSAVRVP